MIKHEVYKAPRMEIILIETEDILTSSTGQIEGPEDILNIGNE